MDKMDEKQIRKWERTRLLGRSRFILRFVSIWGLIPILTWVFLIIIGYVFSITFSSSIMTLSLITGLILYPITGYIIAHFHWRITEERYLIQVSKQTIIT